MLNPKLDRPDVWANIAEIRRAEMDAARAILGVDQAWLGFVDSGLPEGDPLPPLPEGCFALQDVEVAAGPLVRLMREFRPHVVTTYDEEGGYPHPDHIMCHKVSVAAFEAAGDPERYPELGEPWQPLKLYYDIGFSKGKIMALHEGDAGRRAGVAVRGVARSGGSDRPDKGPRITTRVECADYFPVRDDALRAHATQVDPDGFWFHVPMELQQQAWPTEDLRAGPLDGRQPAARVRPVRRGAGDGARPLIPGAGYRWLPTAHRRNAMLTAAQVLAENNSVTPARVAWPGRWASSSSCCWPSRPSC